MAAFIGVVIYLAIIVFFIISGWKVFAKAGQPGWAILIPIYNILIMLKIIGKPAWWIILFFVPIVNFVIAIIFSLELAKVFGKSSGFGIGLLLLGFVFYPILAFGDAQYIGPQSA